MNSMNTTTKSAPSANVDLADAVADAHPVDTVEGPLVVATRCFEADSRPEADVDACVATFEQPFWSCSRSHRAMAIKSSKS
jgi:hypothetical protein